VYRGVDDALHRPTAQPKAITASKSTGLQCFGLSLDQVVDVFVPSLFKLLLLCSTFQLKCCLSAEQVLHTVTLSFVEISKYSSIFHKIRRFVS
jgi:hypothetical protein